MNEEKKGYTLPFLGESKIAQNEKS